MIAIRHALVFVTFLPALAWAQGPAAGERLLAAKMAAVERPPLDRGEVGPLLPPATDALSCGTPCMSGNLAATHPYYDVFLNCSSGAFTARTGPSHSVTAVAGAPQNVIYDGANGSPGTSDVTFFVHDTGTQYTSPTGASTCLFDPPDTLFEPASVGLEQEWSVTNSPGMDLTFRQELVAFGSTEANSGVRMTLSVTNRVSSTVPATIGLRWQIDYQNGGDDGPLFAAVTCDPPVLDRELFGEHDFAPAEIKDFYRIQNNFGFPIFSNVTSTTPLSGIPNTDRPDRLLFGYWGSLVGSPWTYAASEGNPAVDADSAVLYYFGYLSGDAFLLAPGESVTRSVVIFTSSAGIDCGEFVPGCASRIANPPADRSICLGDLTTLDGSGITLTDCEGVVEYEWSDGVGVIANAAVVDVSPAVDTEYFLDVTCSSDLACSVEERVLVSVEREPEIDAGLAQDADPCNEGIVVSWDPARFHDPSGAGVYNIYRSTLSCADALLAPPLVTGLTRESWFDRSTTAGLSYFYVVEAEDARAPTVCPVQGPDHGGAVARLCLSAVLDRGPTVRPAGLGAVLFLAHAGDRVDLRWDAARGLGAGEHFHLLKTLETVTEAFFADNPENDLSLGMSETDLSSRIQFFDLRVADRCESLSVDEFPPG